MILYRKINKVDWIWTVNDRWESIGIIKMGFVKAKSFGSEKECLDQIMKFPERYRHTVRFKESLLEKSK